jgi:prepilin-type N-terminal cleavage/methylation domain-containing protein
MREAGFTLIEIVVVLILMSLLVGAFAPLAAGQIRGQRVRLTQDRMQQVLIGMIGDRARGGYGYLGDLGQLPTVLTELNERGVQTPYAVDPNDGIGAGYNGPYVAEGLRSDVALADAWGTPFQYTAGTPQLISPGADRTVGTGDDLVYPAQPPTTSGNLSVSVTGVPNEGGAACLLGEDDVDVFAAFSQQGTRAELQLAGPVGTGGPFTASNVHFGFHGVRLAGENDFAGAVARDVVEVRGSNTFLRVTLLQPAGGSAACAAAGGGGNNGGGNGNGNNGNGGGNGGNGNGNNGNGNNGNGNGNGGGDGSNAGGNGNGNGMGGGN